MNTMYGKQTHRVRVFCMDKGYLSRILAPFGELELSYRTRRSVDPLFDKHGTCCQRRLVGCLVTNVSHHYRL